MKYTKDSIAKVYELDIVQVARALKIEVKKGTGVYRMCRCFYPGHEDNSPSMWLRLSNKSWYCPVCQKGGNMVGLVMEKLGCEWIKAIEWLAQKFGVELVEEVTAYSMPRRKVCNHAEPRSSQRTGARGHSLGFYPHAESAVNAERGARGDSLGFCTHAEFAENAEEGARRYSLDSVLVQRCFSVRSPFCRALVGSGVMTEGEMREAACRYRLGETRDRGVIFWQVDVEGRVRDGKIMFYGADCHRDHGRHPTWVSSRLHKRGLISDEWSASHCLFGLHLVREGCQVAIVESEKTAVICSVLFPEFVWLATGGLGNLNAGVISAIPYGVDVVVFPDTDLTGETYLKWREAVDGVEGHRVWVSRVLEERASPEQKGRKIDIADLLIEGR